jgi:hypothetical protein
VVLVEPFFRLIRKQAEWFVVRRGARLRARAGRHRDGDRIWSYSGLIIAVRVA